MAILFITMIVGAFAGTVGALLGVGGGMFLVPFLNRVIGLSFPVSAGISLITIIATSTASSASEGRLRLVNLRLAMALEVCTAAGAALGLLFIKELSQSTVDRVFAWTMVLIAVMVLSRIDRRNVMKDASVDVGRMGGRYYDDESGGEVAYRLKRSPVAFAMSLVAGAISNFGIGGGVMTVPALNTWCGIPIKVAAATSSFMLGVTALIIAVHAFLRGDVVPELAAAAVLGVLAGTQIGVRLAARSNAKAHKLVMVVLLLLVAVIYFFDLKAHR